MGNMREVGRESSCCSICCGGFGASRKGGRGGKRTSQPNFVMAQINPGNESRQNCQPDLISSRNNSPFHSDDLGGRKRPNKIPLRKWNENNSQRKPRGFRLPAIPCAARMRWTSYIRPYWSGDHFYRSCGMNRQEPRIRVRQTN